MPNWSHSSRSVGRHGNETKNIKKVRLKLNACVDGQHFKMHMIKVTNN